MKYRARWFVIAAGVLGFASLGIVGVHRSARETGRSPFIADRIVVRFKDGVSPREMAKINAALSVDITPIGTYHPNNDYVLRLPARVSLAEAMRFYRAQSEVKYAVPDTLVGPR